MAGTAPARDVRSNGSPPGSPRGAMSRAAARTTAEIPPTRGPRHTVTEATTRPETTISAGQGPDRPVALRRITRLSRQPALVTTTSQPGGGTSAPSGPVPRRTPIVRQKVAHTRQMSPDRRPTATTPPGGRRTDVTAWPSRSRMTSQ